MGNIPDSIRRKIGVDLHNRVDHPIGITKRLIQAALPDHERIDDLPPLVSVRDNFDLLQIPLDHQGRVVAFRPWSRYPACTKDVSFWLKPGYTRNDMLDLVRSLGGDLVERVHLIDAFESPRDGRRSETWRIVYRSWERSLTNDEVDLFQERMRRELAARLPVELR